MKKEKWKRAASVLAAASTLTGAFGGGQRSSGKSGKRGNVKKNFLKACALTLAGVMAISSLFFADKMEVSAETQTSTETVTIDTTYDKVYDVSAWVADGIETVKFEIAVSEVTGEPATVQFKVDGVDEAEITLDGNDEGKTIERTYDVAEITGTVEVFTEGIKGTLTITCTQEVEDEGEPTPPDTDASEPTLPAVRETASQPIVYAADTIKTMNLDTSYLAPSGGTWDAANDHKVYFGTYNNTPTAFRVLKVESETMMLDCDTSLVSKSFGSTRNNWLTSNLRSWLNGSDYYGNSNVFTAVEKSAIAQTALSGTSEYRLNGIYYKDCADTAYVYLLSAKEAGTLYANDDARKKTGVADWWLRSEGIDSYYPGWFAGDVYNGDISMTDKSGRPGVCPALNIKLSSVLFASANGVSKSSGSLTQVAADTTTKQWKLTLLDTDKSVNVTEGESVTQDGSTVTVPYTYTGSGVSQISVMITSGDYAKSGTEILYYGKLDTNLSESGKGTFTLPDDLPKGYRIYILAEVVNEGNTTDYASKPAEITRSLVDTDVDAEKETEVYEHTHEYEWITVREATDDMNAEEVYQCKYCGDVKYRMEVPNSAYAQFNQDAITAIDRAPSGAAVKLKTNLWVSFRSEVIETLKERPDVSVTIDYLYQGIWYRVTIPAGADLDALEDSEGYYGFRYLDQAFGGSLLY